MSKSLAPQPNRSTNSIVLSWGGTVYIPCSVYTGTESVAVQRKEFVAATGNPAGRVVIDKVTGTVITDPANEIVKRAEASNGVWVDLDNDEIAACTTEKGLATIVTFIPVKDLASYETEGLHQVRPKRVKGKAVPGAEAALAVLLASMAAEKVVALVQVAMRGPGRYAILDSFGDLRWVVTADCIRQPLDLPAVTGITEDHIKAGRAIIKSVVGKSTPTLIDTTAHQIQAYVDSKAAGQPVVEATEAPAPPTDLLGDLLASIQTHKAAS
jgi:non-homologous end joining protein Ku